MKIYIVKQTINKEDRLIAIFTDKHIAENFINDYPGLNNFKLIELKGSDRGRLPKRTI